jgi:putative endonuclease
LPTQTSPPTSLQRGQQAEHAALRHLIENGLTLVAKNFRCRLGEIDLIMKDVQQLVFIEVRLRSNPNFGDGFASVTLSKQKKIIHTARHFLANKTYYANASCRFDVVSVSLVKGSYCLDWITDAFSVQH